MDKPSELVVVLDFGGQYNQLIARRIRDLGVYSEMLPCDTPAETLRGMNPKGIVFSGGPANVFEESAPKVDPAIYDMGIPVLGICYGMQLMAHQLGGGGRRAEKAEYGKTEIRFEPDAKLAKGLAERQQVWMSHGNLVTELPPGFR